MDLIHSESQNLSPDVLIDLFQLDLTKLGFGVFRFTPATNNGKSIYLDGVEYKPLPIKASGFAWEGEGTLPRPKLEFASPDIIFLNTVVDFDDLVGCQVIRRRTFRKYLDDGDFPNTGAMFEPEVYIIEKKDSQNRSKLSFTMTSMLDQETLKLPRKRVFRDTCMHNYRVWFGDRFEYKAVSCPYTGNFYFSPDGEETLDPNKDRCGKKLSDCLLRFKTQANPDPVLPRLAFPGVGRV